MKPRSLAALTAASLLILAACSPGAGPSPTTGPTGIEGRTFLSTAIDGRVLVAGTRVQLSFRDGQVSASAGCNSMSGAYLIDGGRLIARALATTEMGCEQPRMEQDRWLAGLLDGSALALDGETLTLAREGVRLTLLDREVADPDRPLVGTRWVVDAIVTGDTVSSLPFGVVAALTLSSDRVDVETGCNTGGGPVAITATALTFGSITLTKKACLGGATAVERAVTAVLSGEVGYAIEAGTLTLDGGAAGLILRAAP
jgi:heat shock protein HslJ